MANGDCSVQNDIGASSMASLKWACFVFIRQWSQRHVWQRTNTLKWNKSNCLLLSLHASDANMYFQTTDFGVSSCCPSHPLWNVSHGKKNNQRLDVISVHDTQSPNNIELLKECLGLSLFSHFTMTTGIRRTNISYKLTRCVRLNEYKSKSENVERILFTIAVACLRYYSQWGVNLMPHCAVNA